MVLFCIVCMHMNNFWLKKFEKSITDVRKGETSLTIGSVLHYLILFFTNQEQVFASVS